MKLVLLFLLLLLPPALANTDDEAHKACLDARDYSGCVKSRRAMSNEGTEKVNLSRHKPPKASNPEAKSLRQKGKKAQESGKLKQALSLYNQAISIEPSANTYNNRGLIYGSMRKFNKAVSDFDAAIGIDEDFAGAYLNRGVAKSALKDWYGALEDMDIALEKDPLYKEAWRNRGILNETVGNMEGACNDWVKASRLGDSSAFEWIRNQCSDQALARAGAQGCPPGKRIFQKTALFGLIKGARLCLSDYEAESLRAGQIKDVQDTINRMETQRRLDDIERQVRFNSGPTFLNCTSRAYGNYVSTNCF